MSHIATMPLVTSQTPGWYESALRSLEDISSNCQLYENEERSAPSQFVINNARDFFFNLKNVTRPGCQLIEPKFIVSPNGDIVATFGKRPRVLNIRFSENKFGYLFDHPELGIDKGAEPSCATRLALENFVVS